MKRLILIISFLFLITGCKTMSKKGYYVTFDNSVSNDSIEKKSFEKKEESKRVEPLNLKDSLVDVSASGKKEEPKKENLQVKKDIDNIDNRWYVQNFDNLYEVKKNDSLWKIAARKDVYNNPFMWIKIFTANKDVIKKQNSIYPGQILIVPDRKGS